MAMRILEKILKEQFTQVWKSGDGLFFFFYWGTVIMDYRLTFWPEAMV